MLCGDDLCYALSAIVTNKAFRAVGSAVGGNVRIAASNAVVGVIMPVSRGGKLLGVGVITAGVCADVGYCIGKAYWGRGIMPEALKAVIKYLFEEVGLNRIAACHDVNNPKSGRVMDKAGMKLEGIWRRAGKNNLGICDEVWHSIIRAEFEEEN